MAVRHILLAAAAVLVLGLVVFLFLEVRSSPAAPKIAPHGDNRDVSEAPMPTRTVAVADATASTPTPTVNRPVAEHETAPRPPTPLPPPPPPAGVEGTADGVKLEAVMAEANKAYDRMDFDEARTIAQKVLRQQPNNARMLRIMVSAACIENDATEAQKHYNLLGKADREQMKTRCSRYGVTFTEPPAK